MGADVVVAVEGKRLVEQTVSPLGGHFGVFSTGEVSASILFPGGTVAVAHHDDVLLLASSAAPLAQDVALVAAAEEAVAKFRLEGPPTVLPYPTANTLPPLSAEPNLCLPGLYGCTRSSRGKVAPESVKKDCCPPQLKRM